MNDKSFRVLEYQKIKDLLKNEAASQMTREVIDRLLPTGNPWEIQDRMDRTNEAVAVIMQKGGLSLGSFYNLKEHISLARKGGSLSFKQLLEVLYNLKAAAYAKDYLRKDLSPLKIIDELAALLGPLKNLAEEIDRAILSEDEMADNASPELKNLRRKISLQNDAIRNKMNSILNSSENRNMLQDALVTMRQGRYVIPVKQEHKARFPGIVHDQSSTGATLFIEPQAIVNLNNELRELELDERKEVARIVAVLSAMVGDYGEIIGNNQNILVELDFMFAKGRLSAKMKGEAPVVEPGAMLNIKSGRHPLLEEKTAVPISVSLGRDYETLIITGPNTGGKTVTLKTIGLFALMAQSGLHLPAATGTTMPVYENIFADIGDEQSIEQSLSTFSSHMNNIVEIVKEAGENTLVLLDELGAGTDPTEGAALAIAILDELRSRGSSTVATTHYAELKKYAIATEGVQNASMEFNVDTLSPTFRLNIGTPGRSNAFEISKKLGLPEHLIQNARELIAHGDLSFEEVLTAIEKDRKSAEEDRDEALLLKLDLKKRQEALDKEKDKILARARTEAAKILEETRELADEIQRELKEQKDTRSNAKISQLKREISDKTRELTGKEEPETDYQPLAIDDLAEGQWVFVPSLDQRGQVADIDRDKEQAQVQIGSMKVSLDIDELAKDTQGKKEGKTPKSGSRYSSLYGAKAMGISGSINVVGKNLDEAMMDVDKYLDDAFMAGLKEVSIIHGRGAGILREGLSKMFKSHKHVAGFRKGNYNEGGDGVTIVRLK